MFDPLFDIHLLHAGKAATVLSSSVFVLFLLVFPVFCFSNTISFTRDELLNIRQNTPQNLFPDFDYSDDLLDIVVGGAAVLFRCFSADLECRCLASI